MNILYQWSIFTTQCFLCCLVSLHWGAGCQMVAQKGHMQSMAPSLNEGELMPFDCFVGSVGISPCWRHCKSHKQYVKSLSHWVTCITICIMLQPYIKHKESGSKPALRDLLDFMNFDFRHMICTLEKSSQKCLCCSV